MKPGTSKKAVYVNKPLTEEDKAKLLEVAGGFRPVTSDADSDTILNRLDYIESVTGSILESVQRLESLVGTGAEDLANEPKSDRSSTSLVSRVRDHHFVLLEICSALGRIQHTLGIKPD